MNYGWYVVYLLMIVANSIMCHMHDFRVYTWQYWVWFVIVMLSYIAGCGVSR